MMFAAPQDVAVAIGIYAAATTTVVGLVASLYRWKWFRSRFIDPIREDAEHRRGTRFVQDLDEHMPRLLAPIVRELKPNGGSSFRDEFICFRDEVNTFMSGVASDQQAIRDDNLRLSNLVISVSTSQTKAEQARMADRQAIEALATKTAQDRAEDLQAIADLVAKTERDRHPQEDPNE